MIVPEPACVKVSVTPPGEEVAVYEVIVAPPLEPGAVKATVAVVDPVAVAVPTVGAPGTTATVVNETIEPLVTPLVFVATIRK